MKAALKLISLVKHRISDQNWEGVDGKSTSIWLNSEFRPIQEAEQEGWRWTGAAGRLRCISTHNSEKRTWSDTSQEIWRAATKQSVEESTGECCFYQKIPAVAASESAMSTHINGNIYAFFSLKTLERRKKYMKSKTWTVKGMTDGRQVGDSSDATISGEILPHTAQKVQN